MHFYAALFIYFAIRKIADQRRSRANIARLRAAHRLVPSTDRAFPYLLAAHLTFFILTPVEIVVLHRTVQPVLGGAMLVLFVAATLLRWWSITHLGAHWNSQVAVPTNLEPATRGPYRFVRHPNYLAMFLEFLALGLMPSAYLSTICVGILNTIALRLRIEAEEAALFQVPAFQAAMRSKARLIPGVY